MPWASSRETSSPASGVGDSPRSQWLSTSLHHPALRHLPRGRASPRGSGLALGHESGNHGPMSPDSGGPPASSGPPFLFAWPDSSTESRSTSDHLAFNPGIPLPTHKTRGQSLTPQWLIFLTGRQRCTRAPTLGVSWEDGAVHGPQANAGRWPRSHTVS